MYIKEEYNFEDLKKRCWQGAIDTINIIEENNKENELMELLQIQFSGVPTITEVNDLLWFNDEYILESLGIEMEGKENEEE